MARGILSLFGQTSALGQAFHITVSRSIKWADVLQIYLDELEKILGRRPKVLMTEKSLNLSMPGRKWQVIYDRLYNRTFDNSKISQFVDTASFTLPEQGLRQCIRAFADKPAYRPTNWRVQVIYDRLTGERASRKEFTTFKSYVKYIIRRYLYNG